MTKAWTRRRFAQSSLFAAAGLAAAGSTTAPVKMDLFKAGADGYATYRIPGLVVTPKGSLLAYCEARKNARGDWGKIDIQIRRSTDGGKTWSGPRTVAAVTEGIEHNPAAVAQGLTKPGEFTTNNPVAIAGAQTGAVHFLYCVEYGRCFYIESRDDGQTFSRPVEITSAFEGFRTRYPWKVIATGPGHGIQLTNGRLLVPIWMATGEGGHAHRPSAVSVIYSDDHGATWQGGEIVVENGVTYAAGGAVQAFVNPSETIAVQLADGRVMLNIRTESPENRRAVSFSNDGISGWSQPVFDAALYEPICMASLLRVEQRGKDALVFANPLSEDWRHSAQRGKRENLTVRLSYDQGRTWPVAKLLEPGMAGYSDLAAAGGSIYCFYEKGGMQGDQYQTSQLTLARFDWSWLEAGG